MGHIYVRRLSRFLWIKYHQNGRVIRESTGTTNRAKARRMLRVREGDVERGVPIEPRAGRIFFEDAATDLLNDYRVNNRRSFKDAKRRINKHLKPSFKNRRMTSITTADVRAFVAKRRADTILVREAQRAKRPDGTWQHLPEKRRPVSVGEINRELTTLKRMFSLALQAGKIRQKPHIPLLREDNVRTGFFEPDQYRAVLTHLPDFMRPLVTFAYVTGWRINSEILPLKWRNVDLAAGEVRLDPGTTKNREGRVFYVPPDLLNVLTDQRNLADRVQREKGMIAQFVFFHFSEMKSGALSKRSGARIAADGFYHAWCRARTAAGCPASIPHDFRRTAIRNMVRAGIPERVSMKLTGHKTRSVFDRYNVVSDGDLRDAAHRLGAQTGHSFGHSTPRKAVSAKGRLKNP